MGPRSFERGDESIPRSISSPSCAFNGAALFRARRRDDASDGFLYFNLPSMGPRSFERGDLRSRESARRAAGSLQWGRALSSAETTGLEPCGPAAASPFNGAALFRARRPRHRARLSYGRTMPSMGPRSFERGDGLLRSSRKTAKTPSMGPRSFERGDCARTSVSLSKSWSSVYETCRRGKPRTALDVQPAMQVAAPQVILRRERLPGFRRHLAARILNTL